MEKRLLRFVALSSAILAGGSCQNDTAVMPVTQAPVQAQRGALLQSPPTMVATYTPTALASLLSSSTLGQTLLQLTFTPLCTVTVYQLDYQTVDPAANVTPASGALMVPSGGAGCSGARPIVLYAHGTSTDRNYNIADLTSSDNGEGLVVAAVFAAKGYIVAAPDYVGYGTSTLDYHPYLNADQQSNDMMDALTAARSALQVLAVGTTDGGKLFISGYSQGGFVAMATHRAMQAAGMNVTAAAPMSGPYALAAFGDAVFQGQVNASAVPNVVMLASSYQHAYGNMYSNATDVFSAPYATGIDMLLPSTESVSQLQSEGKLPAALFSSVAPDPAFADLTPATEPANLAPVFAQGFGNPFLIVNSYRLSYLQDAVANPDGGFPVATTGLPAASPGNTFRQALKLNDLRTWSPAAPVLLCAGGGDPTVFYFNTQLMQNYWTAVAPTAPFTVLNVDSSPGTNDPYANLKTGFAVAVQLIRANALSHGATDNGDSAVLAIYHATLVPPFCLSAAKAFFDSH
jgi:poly(3-hydroxybutyrate) depolymerase